MKSCSANSPCLKFRLALKNCWAKAFRWNALLALAATSAIGLCDVPAARAAMTHRYTFNGVLDDSIGNADATLVGGAALAGIESVDLPGGAGDYLTLPSQEIDLSTYVDATFEAWFTIDQLASWQRLFDFGDRTVPVAEQNYVYYTVQAGGGGGLAVFANNGNRTEASHGNFNIGQQYHVAVVVDDNANGGSDTLSVYVDGSLATEVAHNKTLSAITGDFYLLGESLITADPNFNGQINEFRIYDDALSARDVRASYLAGPTPLATMRLEVDVVSGQVSIHTDELAPVPIDYYVIESAAGALDADQWNSLDEQGRDAHGPGPGQAWEEADLSNANWISELYLTGASDVSSDQPLALGRAYNPEVLGRGTDGDLTFQYAVQGGSLATGEVVYVSSPVAGDFNGDGQVDGVDFLLWQRQFGESLDAQDYAAWEAAFGEPSGQASSTAVPEPSAWLLALAIVAGARPIVASRHALGLALFR
ncbi:MAG: LamG domain-containing protein [Planctomycetales bacterium]|nr:LamG domain-containing protein [Planctomycetales bacterium]